MPKNDSGETGSFQYMGEPVDLSADEVRLDLATPLEVFLFLVVIFAGLGIFLIPFWEGPWWGSLISLAVCIGTVYAIKYTDCTYILDNRLRRLDYQRIFMGFETRYPVCSFDEMNSVAVQGSFHSTKSGSWWEYGLVIITNRGEMIEVSDSERDKAGLVKADQNGCFLADHLGVEFIPGVDERMLDVKADLRLGKVTVGHKPHEVSFKTVAFILGFIALGVVATVAVIAFSK